MTTNLILVPQEGAFHELAVVIFLSVPHVHFVTLDVLYSNLDIW
jgi:hypothetical protein